MTVPTDISSFAHDIRNILGPALLSAERLGELNAVEGKRNADRIIKAIDKTVEICNSALRATAQPTATRTEDISVSAVLGDATELAAQHRSEPPAVCLDVFGDDVIGVNGDILWRIVFNLVRNASAALEGQKDGHIHVKATANAGCLAVDIKDNGPGIPSEVLDHLFQPGRAGDSRRGRIGLGLPATAQMATKLGGELILRSTSPAGTEVSIAAPYRLAQRLAHPGKSQHLLQQAREHAA